MWWMTQRALCGRPSEADAISAHFATAFIRGAPSTAALKAAHSGVPLGVESAASVKRRAVGATLPESTEFVLHLVCQTSFCYSHMPLA